MTVPKRGTANKASDDHLCLGTAASVSAAAADGPAVRRRARERVLAHCPQRDRRGASALLALHGLEGSSTAHYMRGLADKAFAAGTTSCCSTNGTAAAPNSSRPGSTTPV